MPEKINNSLMSEVKGVKGLICETFIKEIILHQLALLIILLLLIIYLLNCYELVKNLLTFGSY